jgi:hypothetical protein
VRRVPPEVREAGQQAGRDRVGVRRPTALRARICCCAKPTEKGELRIYAIALDTLDRQLKTIVPNQISVAGFNSVWASEGWSYVTAVLDLCSGRVAG